MVDVFRVELISSAQPLYRGEVVEVEVPDTQGYRTFLAHHAPLVTLLQEGRVRIVDGDNSTHLFDVSDGFATLDNDKLIVAVTNGTPVEST